MQLEELTRVMKAGDHGPAGVVDVDRIRAKGRRRAWARRGAVGAAAVATAAVAGGVLTFSSPGGGSLDAAGAEQGWDTLSAYEERVLGQVEGAFAVGGVVVVPGAIDPDSAWNDRLGASELPKTVVPIGAHAYNEFGFLDSTTDYPAFMYDVPPEDSQVRVDNGPAGLACIEWAHNQGCAVSLLAGSDRSGWFFLHELGTERFLDTGEGMQVVTSTVYDDQIAQQSVIGGLDGTEPARVELTLADGSTQPARIDSGGISPGDTVFWATTPLQVTSAVAYDSSGRVLDVQRVRSCSLANACELR